MKPVCQTVKRKLLRNKPTLKFPNNRPDKTRSKISLTCSKMKYYASQLA